MVTLAYVSSDWIVLSDPEPLPEVRKGVRQLEEIRRRFLQGKFLMKSPYPNERTAIFW